MLPAPHISELSVALRLEPLSSGCRTFGDEDDKNQQR